MSDYEGMYNKIYFHCAVNVLTDNTTIDVSLIKMVDTTADEYFMEASLMNDTPKSVEMVANTNSHDGQTSTDSPDNFLDGNGYGKDLQVLFDIYDNGEYITIDNLSTGTVDQLYLSFRLSTINEISEEKIPIMLDEAFAYYDEKRLENILKYLNEKIENQIIIFTCTNREINILDNLNIKYNLIEL